MIRKYWERGFSVIPVKGKDAFLTSWSRWSEKLPTEEEVDEWEKRYPFPQYGIGVVLGPASGICAIDIDSESADIRALCPLSPVVKRGANGETRFFRYNPELVNISDMWRDIGNGREGVEIFVNRRQTVLPPSIHPRIKAPYLWLSPDTLENYPKEDLPDLTIKDISKMREFFSQYTAKGSGGGGVFTPGIGRNNRLTLVACAIICRSTWLSNNEIAAQILELDKNEHPKTYFDDPEEAYFRKGNSAFDRALVFVKEHRKRLIAKGEAFISEPVEINIKDLTEKTTPEVPQYPPVGGVVGMFRDAILSISRSEQADMALGAALSIAGTLSANRFSINGKPCYTTMYVLNIAGTSSGKGAAIDFIHELFGPRGIGSVPTFNLLGLHNYSSDVAIIARLQGQRTRLDVIDEFGQVFKGLATKGDRKSAVGECLKILFSAKETFAGHHTKTDGTVGACLTPSVSLFGATQPETLLNNASPETLFDGFMGRFMYFMEDLSARWLGNQLHGGLDRDVLDYVSKRCLEIYPQAPLIERDILGNIILEEHMREFHRANIEIDKPVVNAMNEMDRTHYDATQKKKRDGNKMEAALLGRSIELTEKLSRILCISGGTRTLTLEHLDTARKIVEVSAARSTGLLVQAGSPKDERDCQRVVDAIGESPGQFLDRRSIMRKLHLKSKQVDEILSTLVDRGVIQPATDPTIAKHKHVFRLAEAN